MSGSDKSIGIVIVLVVLALVGGGLFMSGIFDSDPEADLPQIADDGRSDGTSEPGFKERDLSGVKPIEGTEPFDPNSEDPAARAQVGEESGGPRILGIVRGPTGKPVSNAHVRLILDVSSMRGRAQEGDVVSELKTRGDGGFVFDSVARAQRYVVSAAHDEFTTARTMVDSAIPAQMQLTLRLSDGLSFGGLVQADEGGPIEGAVIQVFDINVHTMEPLVRPERIAVSGADGSYTMEHVAPGMKKVICVKKGFATDGRYPLDARPERLSGKKVDFVLGKGQGLQGVVVDSETGAPVEGALVTARPIAPQVRRAPRNPRDTNERKPQQPSPMQPFSRGFLIQSARSDAEGKFSLGGLMTGRYVLTSICGGYQPFTGQQVSSGSTGVTVRLRPSARISGMVVDADTGQPVPRFSLALSGNGDPRFFPTQGQQRFENEEGLFEYVDVRPGKVHLLAKAEGYAGGSSDPLVVSIGQRQENVTIRLVRGATIKGRVTDVGGKGIRGATVHLEGENQAMDNPLIRLLQQSVLGSQRSATTDSDGNWTLPNVYEGLYNLRVEHKDYSEGRLGPVQVPNSGEVEADLVELRQGGAVTGTVRIKGGEGVDTQATVTIRAADGTSMISRSAQTDGSGTYTITGLKPGNYFVSVTRREGVDNPFEMLLAPRKPENMITVGEGQKITVDL